MNYQSRISDLESQVYRDMKAVPEWAAETIQERPVSTIFAVFAAGLVLGVGCVALSMSTCSSRRNSKTAAGTAQQVYDSMKATIPDQLKSRLSTIWGS